MANNVDLVMRLLAEDRASAAFKKVGAEVDATGSKYGKFAKRAATALAAVGVVKFAKDSIKAYSDAEQSQAKLEQAYRKFPKTANLSIDALRAYNSELQTKTKYDDDDTAAMQAHLAMFNLTGQQIKALTPLVQDLASAQGIDLASASDLVGKALMGNTRGLKAIGINFKATGDAAKDFAAIQAALNQQVGGFAENEGKTAAGQAAILSNLFGDLQETVGGALVPALTAAIGVLKPVVQAFNSLPEPVKTSTVLVAGAGAALVILVPKIAAAKAAITELGIASNVSSGRVKGFGKAIGIATGAMIVASAANNTLSESSINLNDSLGKIGDNHWWDQLGTGVAHLVGAQTTMDDAAASIDGVDQSLADLVSKGNLTAAYTKFTELRQSFADSGQDVSVFDSAFVKYRAALDTAEKPTTDMADAVGGVGSAAKTAASSVATFQTRIDKLIGKNIDAKTRAIEWKNAIADLSSTIKDNGKTLDDNTAKGRANELALLALVNQAKDNANADLAAGVAKDKVSAKYATNIKQIEREAEKLGLNKQQVEKLIGAYEKLPAEVKTVVKAPGLASTLAFFDKLNDTIRKIPGHVGISVGAGGDVSVGHGTGGHAAGGYMRKGETAWVGEHGAELFTAPTAGRVVPASVSRADGDWIAAPVYVQIDGKTIAESQVVLKRRNGGNLPYL